jgi:hypothetical protein
MERDMEDTEAKTIQSSAASTENLADEITKEIQADKPVKKTKKERSPAQKAAFEKAQAKLKEKRAAAKKLKEEQRRS